MPLTNPPSVVAWVGNPTLDSPVALSVTGIQVGRVYVMAITRASASGSITSIVDNGSAGGNVWVPVVAHPTSGTTGRRTEQWVCIATKTFTSVTITFDNTTNMYATLLYLPDVTGAVDVTNGGVAAGSTNPPDYPITATEADTMGIAVIGYTTNTQAQTGLASGSPWTKLSGGHASAPTIAYRLNLPVGTATAADWIGISSPSAQASGQAVANYKSLVVPSGRTLRRGSTVQTIRRGSAAQLIRP